MRRWWEKAERSGFGGGCGVGERRSGDREMDEGGVKEVEGGQENEEVEKEGG